MRFYIYLTRKNGFENTYIKAVLIGVCKTSGNEGEKEEEPDHHGGNARTVEDMILYSSIL
jgi:hypothetical protein